MKTIPDYVVCSFCREKIFPREENIIEVSPKEYYGSNDLKTVKLMIAIIDHTSNCKKSKDPNKGEIIIEGT